MNIGKYNLLELAAEFGTHEHCIEKWLLNLEITEDEINLALTKLAKPQRRSMMINYLKPTQFIIDRPELIEHSQRIALETIKDMNESDFEEYLSLVSNADYVKNRINGHSFPYNSYCSFVLLALRKATKKADIKFIRGMFGRKISHHSYPYARKRLEQMATQ